MAETNHLAMSDEEFLKQPLPETAGVSSEEAPASQDNPNEGEDPNAGKPEGEAEVPADGAATGTDAGTAAAEGEDQNKGAGSEGNQPEGEAAKTGEEAKAPDPAGAAAPGSEAKPEGDAAKDGTKQPEAQQEPLNFEKLYGDILAPIKANGKEIKVTNADEARTLMQMGANYTQKMQQLAPHRKLITMLTKNSIDEDKLSLLIDLDNGDKNAIAKYIKDKGIDPLDIDTNTEPAYREGSHKVSDQEQGFRTQLDELGSTPEGKETLTEIQTWDQASKDTLWESPGIMPVIHAHREAGIYAQIVAEVDRQKTLGQMPADTPFLEAYQTAGDALDKQGVFGTKAAATNETTTDNQPKADPTPVATRTAAPKSDAAAAAAAAAAPSRSGPGKASEAVNYLSMSDEEFAKVAALKV